MRFDSYCTRCLVNRHFDNAAKLLKPEDRHKYLLEVMRIITEAPADVAAPFLTPQFEDALAKYGISDQYAAEKKWANDLILPRLPEMQRIIESSADPLLTALKFSQAGNFLDFAVLKKDTVDENIHKAMANAPEAPLDPVEYGHFAADVAAAKTMLILGDNAGEIAFDTLLVKQLKKQFPALSLYYGVRGGNALNDATREDAAYVGMDKLVPIVDNGSRISGTELAYLGQEMREIFNKSDVILAKGQANFETLSTCGANVYYNFLCKCDRFCKILQAPRFTGMFLCEKRLPEMPVFPD